ncbi:PucR family transcriptional regulator, partial [Actinomadura kijaniata]
SSTVPITLDDEQIGTVWLERSGPPNPLDEVLLDRLAIATAAAVERYGPARTTMADPALVELVISADSDEAARARALRLLGFAADLPVHVAAVRTRLPLDRIGTLVCPARPVKAAPLAGVGVILATTLD